MPLSLTKIKNIALVTTFFISSNFAPSAVIATERPIEDKWALVVGISKFKDSRIPRLRYPAKDARDFSEFLVQKGNFAKDHVLLLTDENATYENIKTALGDSWLPKRVVKDDLVLIYISTHGSPKELDAGKENWLIAYDTKLDKLYTTGIELEELSSIVKKRTGCDRIVLLLDACNSGAAKPGASKGLFRAANFDVNSLVGEGEIILSSSQANQRSWESKQYTNGVFTGQLIRSLESCGTTSPLSKVFDNLKLKVEVEVRQDRQASQIPVYKSKWKGKELALLAPSIRPRKTKPSTIINAAPVVQLKGSNSINSESPSKERVAQQHLARAREYYKVRNIGMAVSEYRKVVALQPDNFKARASLANLLGALGQFDEAITESKKCIETEPNYYRPYMTLAMIYANRGNLNTAENMARKSLRLNPNSKSAQTTLNKIISLKNAKTSSN